jgi:hypothetical protein
VEAKRMIIVYEVEDSGPLVLGWEADLSSVRNVSKDMSFRILTKIFTRDTNDMNRIRDRLAKHAIGATVFRRSPELIAAIWDLAQESWRG